ncbi:MAG: type II toxin-antitoxin system RelE/ParE family toxin [Planctomycetota bacterium]|nr:MAG: type II toxin-antitoxin system RelE/ParE family toxin [Planctomycetota bacterium]
MKRYPVAWSQPARLDVLGIVDFIASDSPHNAERILDRLETRAATLDQFPERGRVVSELFLEGITTIRELIERPWRIVYEYDGTAVTIIGVFDSRRHLHSILMERFLQM